MIPEPITIDGKSGQVMYLDAQWQPTTAKKATMARVLFDDGTSAFYQATPKAAPNLGGVDVPRDRVFTMPFADYEDFDDCVAKNQDKDDPKAYCGWLKHRIEGQAYRAKLAAFLLKGGQ